jgi:hypothetical protein
MSKAIRVRATDVASTHTERAIVTTNVSRSTSGFGPTVTFRGTPILIVDGAAMYTRLQS